MTAYVKAIARLPWVNLSIAANCILYGALVQDTDASDDLSQLANEIRWLKPAFDGRYSRAEIIEFEVHTMRFFTECPRGRTIHERRRNAVVGVAVLGAIRGVAPKRDT